MALPMTLAEHVLLFASAYPALRPYNWGLFRELLILSWSCVGAGVWRHPPQVI